MDALRPIAGVSLASEAFDKLVEAITSGEFEPGDRLSESELARQLEISRGPLREALGRLEGRLVRRTPRIGVRVIDFTRDHLEQLFYVREALEGMAARLAAERMSMAELDEIGELLSKHATQPELVSGHGYFQHSEDEDFHFAIVRAAHCDQIAQLLLDTVYYQLRTHRRRSSAQPGRARAAYGEHLTILEKLQGRDPEGAEEAMRRHIRNARFSALASTFASPKAKSRRRGAPPARPRPAPQSATTRLDETVE